MATPDPIDNGDTAKVTTLATLQARQPPPELNLPEVTAGFTSLRSFELLQRAAKALMASSLVPQIYQNNMPNCVIALEMAQRIGASPLMVMQNLYIVHNRPGWSAKFLIACFNQCGRFSAVRYTWSGTKNKDDWGCQAWATEKSTGARIEGPVITWALANSEGWVSRSGSKWKTMPEKMFMYRAAAWMIDTHAPEISMGLRTEDEVGDTFEAERASDGLYRVTQDSLRQADPSTQQTPSTIKTPVQPVSAAEAVNSLKEAGSPADLDKAWKELVKNFRETNRQMPLEIEATYNERCESMEQNL